MVVEAEANSAQVKRILQSKAFRTSEVHRNLLNYLAEKSLSGDADSLKEYTVGLDVFAKPASYDPRQESVVRMHMARLRQKLAEYYRTEGLEDPIIVDLPKGGFRVTFEPRPVVPVAPDPVPVQPIVIPAPPRSFQREWILGGMLLISLALAVYFGFRLREAEKTTPALAIPASWTPELRQLWEPLLATDRPLVVCLATQDANDKKSSSLTGLATANGAFLLGQFLADRKQNVYLTGSEALTMPEISMGNVVYLGPAGTNRPLHSLSVVEELTEDAKGIRNIHPKPGEPELIEDHAAGTAGVSENHTLITHAPGLNGKGDLLYISGNHVSSVTAGVEALTDPVIAKNIVEKMRKADGSLPRYYQIGLRVKSMDDTPVEITYLLHRELKAGR
jgi:hypothetical protein